MNQKAKAFYEYWKDKGYEKGQSQPFWLALLRDVFCVSRPEEYIDFEDQVKLDNTAFIDGYIEDTHTMIEQKSRGKDLNKAIRQSDGSYLTAFQQAKRYASELPYSKRPRWIITCNFEEFYIYDMENPNAEAQVVKLENLEDEFYRLDFMVNDKVEHIQQEMALSIAAGEIVGKLYDALYKQYEAVREPTEDDLRSLNELCVRLVFCFYAEDAGVFGEKDMFYNYMSQFDAATMRQELINLFKVLNQEDDKRDPFMRDDLKKFPYVNGGLFANEDIVIPQFTEEIRKIILQDASYDFNWAKISPTIFGAVFESTLNPETRRQGGMHYTSIENIHKVIDPLFLDDLKEELEQVKNAGSEIKVRNAAKRFQEKLAGLTFLDPAAGSGNFLTETYLCLRKLENEALKLILGNQVGMLIEDVQDPIKVTIDQFYGIEINDFAVSVAKTAMWIAESQMMERTKSILHSNIDFLPLTTNVNIVEGNALRMNWEDVIPSHKLNYIMGNPPFIGARLMNKEQKEDIKNIFDGWKNAGNLDYVTCWYKKCAEYMSGTNITASLVSTNSITQGETAAILWEPLMDAGLHIDFAYRSFVWDSEASIKAHVHCVIIGFHCGPPRKTRNIYINGSKLQVDNINAYLVDAPNVFITARKTSLYNVPPMVFGSMANDGGYLFLTPEERKDVLSKYPEAESCIKRFLGSREFINNGERYCLWLKGINPSIYRGIPFITDRIHHVKNNRESSSRASTRGLAETPYLFGEIRQPNSKYILVPRHSSERRRYIPLGFISPDIICGDANMLIPSDSKYLFGVITSNVHMAWMRTVCGRIKSDYRYSASVVYNNFPWPSPTPDQKAKIEQTAQGILDARALYPDSSLADLYDELTMPPELRKAHQENDKAVMAAYGITKNDEEFHSESACVAMLMKMYKELTEKEK